MHPQKVRNIAGKASHPAASGLCKWHWWLQTCHMYWFAHMYVWYACFRWYMTVRRIGKHKVKSNLLLVIKSKQTQRTLEPVGGALHTAYVHINVCISLSSNFQCCTYAVLTHAYIVYISIWYICLHLLVCSC